MPKNLRRSFSLLKKMGDLTKEKWPENLSFSDPKSQLSSCKFTILFVPFIIQLDSLHIAEKDQF